MKNGMRAKLKAKDSTFLRGLKGGSSMGQLRRNRRMHTSMPNSSKIGAGKTSNVIRSIAMSTTKHRKNHGRGLRSATKIGITKF